VLVELEAFPLVDEELLVEVLVLVEALVEVVTLFDVVLVEVGDDLLLPQAPNRETEASSNRQADFFIRKTPFLTLVV
jgi:hypothetical protein